MISKVLGLSALSFLLIAASCPPPKPPDPPDPPPTCLPDVPWCEATQTCSTPTAPCKHNPTQDPTHCELAPACPPTPPVDPCYGKHCPRGQKCVDGICVDIPDACDGITCSPGYKCSAGKCIKVDDPPVVGWEVCPKEPAPGYRVTINDKRYGNGIDSTIYIENDPEFCRLIHGVSANSCHLEGWPLRAPCEMKLAGGCPIWEYSVNASDKSGDCLQAEHPVASCDHWGNPVTRDDPKTPEFEGEPKACGNQRDLNGDPKAGFFIIGHGTAYFRACVPSSGACGAWVAGKDK